MSVRMISMMILMMISMKMSMMISMLSIGWRTNCVQSKITAQARARPRGLLRRK